MDDSPNSILIRFPLSTLSLRLLSVLSVTMLLGSSASAQQLSNDTIVFQLPSGNLLTTRCEVMEYTGERITFRTSIDGDPVTQPTANILRVETPQSASHVKGLDYFRQNQPTQALEEFQKALTQENRAWVRREIYSMQVRSALKLGNYALAGRQFLLLVKSDPQTHFFKYMPVKWGSDAISSGDRYQGELWLQESHDVAKLLAAGLLLMEPEHTRTIEQIIKKLRYHSDKRIASTALGLLWRMQVSRRTIQDGDLQEWSEKIQKMPSALRGGPYYILGRAYETQRDYERAAASLLWVPVVYSHDETLAARACLEAADALLQGRQQTAALTLYREVVQRFPQTPSAQVADQLLRNPAGLQPPSDQ